jgi:[ribosomal protein S18]-alanine N-acetyltransferase
MMSVREGSAHDVAAIMPIMQDAFSSEFGEMWSAAQCVSMLSLPGSSLLLCYYKECMTGFALSRWVMDEEELLLIGVSNSFRKKGVGSHLITYMIDRARNNNRGKLFLEVRENNNARHFYYGLGFIDIGRRKNYYSISNGNALDAVTMCIKI